MMAFVWYPSSLDKVSLSSVEIIYKISKCSFISGAKALNKQNNGDNDDSDNEADKENNVTVVDGAGNTAKTKRPKIEFFI